MQNQVEWAKAMVYADKAIPGKSSPAMRALVLLAKAILADSEGSE